MNIGQALLMARKARGLTQRDIASVAGISPSYISLIENGERSDVPLQTITDLATALGLPVGILLMFAAERSDLAGLDSELIANLQGSAYNLIRQSDAGSLI